MGGGESRLATAFLALIRLGFEIVLDPKSQKMIIGRPPIEKLAALVDLTFVRYVGPMKTTTDLARSAGVSVSALVDWPIVYQVLPDR